VQACAVAVLVEAYRGDMTAVEELQAMLDRGVRFTLHQEAGGRFTVRLGEHQDTATGQGTFATFDDAVAWLRAEVVRRLGSDWVHLD
jgi:hypothetical protein